MNHADSLALSGLGPIMFGKFTEECAQMVMQIASKKKRSSSAIAFTWFHESTFAKNPNPQTNGAGNNTFRWDFGPMQLNLRWTCASVFINEFYSDALSISKIFGDPDKFINPDGTPATFNGDPIANISIGTNRLFAHKGNLEEQVVAYTGPDHQPTRRESWHQLGPMFDIYFANYKP